MAASRKNHWFWAWLIQMTVPKNQIEYQQAKVEVWKNLVILRAKSAEHALEKAYHLGSLEEGDCHGSLTLNGGPAVTEFLGVEDIGLIHDDFADGSEILWALRKCRQKTARRFVKKSKEKLLADLIRELR